MNKPYGQKAGFELESRTLQNRLNLIIQTIPGFWEQRIYTHFTNHGPEHSERVLYQKIAQLAQELPLDRRLTEDEIFIISASAWLYEIGMQSPNLPAVLPFRYEPGVPLSTSQLQHIRSHKHLLTQELIVDSIRNDYEGPQIDLGLSRPDDYTRAIAEVCRWCSDEPLTQIDSTIPVSGIEVRLRLMVALLRLADQLYIDASRVNLNQLPAFHLAPLEEARWWVYHYTQTLPIDKGKIRFYYSIPIAQKQYLGHIRALIEPGFEYKQNPVIQYLHDEHDLRLSVQQRPQIRLDQQAGFVQEMPRAMLLFLRSNVEPIKTDGTGIELIGASAEEKPRVQALMVLDFENLLLQLGLLGYFPSLEEIKQLVITLGIKANEIFDAVVQRWAFGHWQRPDMQEAKGVLEALYQMKSLEDDEQKNANLLRDEIARVTQTNVPAHLLLVAPREEIVPAIIQLTDRKQAITAWLCDFSDTNIFRMLIRNTRPLTQIIPVPDLSTAARAFQQAREELQELCILKLDDTLQGRSKNGIPITEAISHLHALPQVAGHEQWWICWLSKEQILLPNETQQHYAVQLNSSHQQVSSLRRRRSLVIQTAQLVVNERQEVTRSVLLQRLAGAREFHSQPEQTAGFCQLLQTINVFQPVAEQDGACWRLNREHWSVLAENADLLLSLFVIGIDHFLLREGYPSIHEHILAGKLASYVGYNAVQAIYHLARDKGMVRSRVSSRTLRNSQEHMVEVSLVEEHAEVRKALRHRNLLLLGLYNRGSHEGLTADALWENLMKYMQRCFKLPRQEFDQWLSAWQRDGIIKRCPSQTQPGQARLLLRSDALLVRQLLGRLNVLNLVKTMRIMGAGRQSKPAREIIEQMRKYITYDSQLAVFTLHYARSIGLVETSRPASGDGDGECDILSHNPFIRALDARNLSTCRELATLVEKMSQKFPQGRVPAHKLMQEMEQESRFGIAHEEHSYWINQAIHQHKLLLEYRGERVVGRGPQLYYAIRPDVQHEQEKQGK
ncbi:MAG TPA: hypothetical protein VGF67_21450 [Ktedonobacteraceae bacterium]|jgi:hypothetical protein